jgi:hypothetical protein
MTPILGASAIGLVSGTLLERSCARQSVPLLAAGLFLGPPALLSVALAGAGGGAMCVLAGAIAYCISKWR